MRRRARRMQMLNGKGEDIDWDEDQPNWWQYRVSPTPRPNIFGFVVLPTLDWQIGARGGRERKKERERETEAHKHETQTKREDKNIVENWILMRMKGTWLRWKGSTQFLNQIRFNLVSICGESKCNWIWLKLIRLSWNCKDALTHIVVVCGPCTFALNCVPWSWIELAWGLGPLATVGAHNSVGRNILLIAVVWTPLRVVLGTRRESHDRVEICCVLSPPRNAKNGGIYFGAQHCAKSRHKQRWCQGRNEIVNGRDKVRTQDDGQEYGGGGT